MGQPDDREPEGQHGARQHPPDDMPDDGATGPTSRARVRATRSASASGSTPGCCAPATSSTCGSRRPAARWSRPGPAASWSPARTRCCSCTSRPSTWASRSWTPARSPPPPADRTSQHRRGRSPSRLVYEVPEGTRIAWTLRDVLAALPGLRLRVATAATPAGKAEDTRHRAAGRAGRPRSRRRTGSWSRRAGSGAFRHAVDPGRTRGPGRAVAHPPRPCAPTTAPFDDGPDDEQRIVRALWTRDRTSRRRPAFDQPLIAFDREAIVDADPRRRPSATRDTPADGDAAWRCRASAPGSTGSSRGSSRRTSSTTGTRRTWAATATSGWPTRGSCSPSGTAASWSKITEREIKHRGHPGRLPVAALVHRACASRRATYPPSDRDNPFGQVTLSPLVTPDIDKPPQDNRPFVPTRNGVPFPFTLTTVDRGGRPAAGRRRWSSSRRARTARDTFVFFAEEASPRYFPVRQIQGRGQTLAVAPPVKAGDTSIEVRAPDLRRRDRPGDRDLAPVPHRDPRRSCPSMRHLAPQAPAVDLVFAKPYLTARPAGPRARTHTPVPGDAQRRGARPRPEERAPRRRLHQRLGPGRRLRRAEPVRARASRGRSGAIGEDGNGAVAVRRRARSTRRRSCPGRCPSCSGCSACSTCWRPAGLDEAPAFVSDALGRGDHAARRGAAAAGRARRRPGPAGRRRSPGAAHGGAQAVAQHAKDAARRPGRRGRRPTWTRWSPPCRVCPATRRP